MALAQSPGRSSASRSLRAKRAAFRPGARAREGARSLRGGGVRNACSSPARSRFAARPAFRSRSSSRWRGVAGTLTALSATIREAHRARCTYLAAAVSGIAYALAAGGYSCSPRLASARSCAFFALRQYGELALARLRVRSDGAGIAVASFSSIARLNCGRSSLPRLETQFESVTVG